MSIVGTRPPLISETNLYEPHHKAMLQKLEKSEFADCCVFKGGTSLSKCYPGSIERFSEDIDLTFLASGLSKKQYDKSLKKIEKIMTNFA